MQASSQKSRDSPYGTELRAQNQLSNRKTSIFSFPNSPKSRGNPKLLLNCDQLRLSRSHKEFSTITHPLQSDAVLCSLQNCRLSAEFAESTALSWTGCSPQISSIRNKPANRPNREYPPYYCQQTIRKSLNWACFPPRLTRCHRTCSIKPCVFLTQISSRQPIRGQFQGSFQPPTTSPVLCQPLKLGLNCICTTDFQSVGGNLCRRTGSPSYPKIEP